MGIFRPALVMGLKAAEAAGQNESAINNLVVEDEQPPNDHDSDTEAEKKPVPRKQSERKRQQIAAFSTW